jgi:probable F420-dependent oxidoreductase
VARRAELLGYSTFGVSDHFATGYAPLLVLQFVAACTSKIRLATLVLNNDFRHPAVLAKETATLDVLSGGRLELGIGAGWLAGEYEQAGIPFDPGAVRVARLEEAVTVLKLLFADPPASFPGRFYAIAGLNGVPKPVQKPHPPLMLGGTRPRLLRLAARQADIVGFDSGPDPSTWTLEALADKARLVWEAGGSRTPELHLNPDAWGIGNRSQIVERWARHHGVAAADLDRSAHVLAGSVDQVVEHLERLREVTGISYVTIRSDEMEDFAPVVELLAGR